MEFFPQFLGKQLALLGLEYFLSKYALCSFDIEILGWLEILRRLVTGDW